MAEEKSPIEQAVWDAVRSVFYDERWPIFVHIREDRAELLADIKKLLEEQQGLVRCRFSDTEVDDLTRMLTGGGERKAPLKDIRTWLREAQRIVIADPYLMHGDPTSWGWSGLADHEKKQRAEEYAEEIRQILGSVKEVDVYHLPGPPKELVTAMKRIAFKGRKVRCIPTTEIHDRVWIKDGDDARIVGTSFGGIGRKLSFMLKLPPEDRVAFQTELKRIGLRAIPAAKT